jgi:hypothetical protein
MNRFYSRHGITAEALAAVEASSATEKQAANSS